MTLGIVRSLVFLRDRRRGRRPTAAELFGKLPESGDKLVPEDQQHPNYAGEARRNCHDLIGTSIKREQIMHDSILREISSGRTRQKQRCHAPKVMLKNRLYTAAPGRLKLGSYNSHYLVVRKFRLTEATRAAI